MDLRNLDALENQTTLTIGYLVSNLSFVYVVYIQLSLPIIK